MSLPMRFIRASTLEEYAFSFWTREAAKHEAPPPCESSQALLDQLYEKHRYKLPFEHNEALVVIASLDRKDIADLLIHDHMATSSWMEVHLSHVPNPCPRRLSQLATLFLADGPFGQRGRGTPLVSYDRWRAEGQLDGKIAGDTRTLVQCDRLGNLEIVDGWGRLIAYEALVQEGLEFAEVETFVAYRLGSSS